MRDIPSLRFKEFNDKWEEKKLGEVCEINPKSFEIPEKFIYIDLESVEKGILKENKILSKENAPSRAKRVVEKMDILYQMVRPYQQNNLLISNLNENKYVASTGYAQIRTKSSTHFLYQLLHTEKFTEKVLKKCTGTSYPAINSEDLSNIQISYSPSLKEQEKIGDFLSTVDSKIAKYEKKLELLKEYKKGVMEKIFTQKIRFKDSNGENYPEWEEKKLGEILFKNKEKNKNSEYDKVQTVSNKYGFINQEEYFEDRRVASINLNNYYVVRKNAFAYNPSRIDTGSLALKKEEDISVISPLYVSFYPNEDYVNIIFLFNWFFNIQFFRQMNNSFQGSVRNNLNYEIFSNFNIQLPSLEEQEKIANYLSAIDEKLEREEKKIEDLKEFKKGLLQKMFV